MKTERTTIDLTPTWEGLMPVLIAVLRDGTPEGKRGATEELMTLARSVDRQNEENRLARQKAIGNAIEGKGVES